MTRPIYEPSLPRADAYLDFQQQQLFRRPAPTSNVFEWGLAIFTTNQTVTTGFGSALQPDWDEVYVPSGQTLIEVNPNFSSAPNQPFQINRSGVYALSTRQQFTDIDWTDFRMVQILHSSFAVPTAFLEPKGGGSGQGSSIYVAGTPTYISLSVGGVDLPSIEVSQTSGSDKTLTGGHFLVAYMGSGSQDFADITPVTP